jgi:hypothetical protein
MHVNPIPAIFTKHLKEYLWPLLKRLFLRDDELEVKRKTKIELMTDPTLLLVNQHRGY